MIRISDIRYLCIDLDGTLLTSSKNIDDDTIFILKQCMAKGLKVILVSGRHFSEIKPYVNILGLTHEDYVISCDGEHIFNCDGTEIWCSPRLAIADVKYIWNCLKVDSMALVTNESDIYITKSFTKRLKRFIYSKVTKSTAKCWSLHDLKESHISDVEKIRLQKKDMPKDLFSRYCIHESGEMIEILPLGVNKYTSLCILERLGGIHLNSALYFGNDYNDYECFENMLNTVAMKNSPRCLLERASYVTETNDEKGVYLALTDILL